MKYTCAIVEAEPLAEATLRRYIARTDFLDLIWTAVSAEEAEGKANVDLLVIALTTSSIEPDSALAALFAVHEQVIITSVYPQEKAIVSLNPVAFLTKPISFDAFAEALSAFLIRKS